MANIVDVLNSYIWSNYLIGLCLLVGCYFSLRTRFLQVRHIKEMVSLMFEGKPSASGVSSFQALTLSLSGRVGTGNIAGVASAITFGGPGAVFWMWAVAFLGASTAYVEATLAQIYKEKEDGQYRGGPAYFIEKGMGQKWYAMIFAFATIIGAGLLLPGVQANSIASGVEHAFGISTSVTGAAVTVALGLIIFGGIKRIASFAEVVVPFMALGYIIVAIIIIAMNVEQLGSVFALIFKSAFNMEAGFGAVIGLAVQWGVKRGIYSNEAGQGTAPHAAAAAEVSHPAKQGLVQGFSVYVDTLFVCTATALMILLTGAYNVVNPAGGFLVENLKGVEAGPGYTQMAVETLLPGFGDAFVAIALLFFAFTTIIAYYYIAETNVTYITNRLRLPGLSLLLRVVLMGAVFYGSIKSASVAWGMGDVGVGIMAWLNIIAILIMQRPALLALKDYEAQRKQGLNPVFRPSKLGIKNAEFWDERVDADKQ
ncbi:alanine/glycine:cation symporter family protein [Pokkaliibacter sp. CJK22405]|uniref:alanine/glycine:cation symporter family protein n=1 Tax=Pokkaliibacter sp. CJK22405 TaxID=3384615 RepID=UPI00398542F2